MHIWKIITYLLNNIGLRDASASKNLCKDGEDMKGNSLSISNVNISWGWVTCERSRRNWQGVNLCYWLKDVNLLGRAIFFSLGTIFGLNIFLVGIFCWWVDRVPICIVGWGTWMRRGTLGSPTHNWTLSMEILLSWDFTLEILLYH